ncbi:MAG: AtpZ/AtpI family protein [Mesorhizobium sp.]|nr:AtpZ/AtpI family protein [Mesorhizobium sp.]
MATSRRPDETGKTGPERPSADAGGDDLDRRRRDLEAAIAARRPEKPEAEGGSKTGGMAGMGYALRLSSEFIAGIVVGVAIGWVIDEAAGTSPWGLIIFLMLGFGAGVLNILRSAGMVAEQSLKPRKGDGSAKD